MGVPFASILHRDGVRRLVDERTFARGQRYHEQGRVASLERVGSRLHGKIRGDGAVYDARIWARGGSLAFSCTCPAAAERSPCKHGVALALTWVEELRDDREIAELRGALQKLGKDVLVELVVEAAAASGRARTAIVSRLRRGRPS
jgi:uncharacterized Zn finger protein